MGHIASKDIFRKLGHRLDQAPVRTPWTPVFRELVETLYSKPEAELVVRLPYRPRPCIASRACWASLKTPCAP
jgi:hypothetical protein